MCIYGEHLSVSVLMMLLIQSEIQLAAFNVAINLHAELLDNVLVSWLIDASLGHFQFSAFHLNGANSRLDYDKRQCFSPLCLILYS